MGTGGMDSGWYSLKRDGAVGRQEGPFTWGELSVLSPA